MIVSMSPRDRAIVWDGATGTPLRTLVQGQHTSDFTAMGLGGTCVVVGYADGTCYGWDLLRFEQVRLTPEGSRVNALAVDPAGEWVVIGRANGVLAVVDRHTRIEHFVHEFGLPVTSCAVRADRKHIAVGLADGSIGHIATQPKWRCRTYPSHRTRITSLCFTPDCHYLVSASYDTAIRVLYTRRKGEDQVIEASGPVASVAASPDSRTIAVVGRDGAIRIWDIESKTWTREVAEHAVARCVAFAGTDGVMITGNRDSTLSLWQGL